MRIVCTLKQAITLFCVLYAILFYTAVSNNMKAHLGHFIRFYSLNMSLIKPASNISLPYCTTEKLFQFQECTMSTKHALLNTKFIACTAIFSFRSKNNSTGGDAVIQGKNKYRHFLVRNGRMHQYFLMYLG